MNGDLEALFVRAARAAAEHRETVSDRPVARGTREDAWAAFDGELPEGPTAPEQVLDDLLGAAMGALLGRLVSRLGERIAHR